MNETIPVGAVESCVSGTSVERWMPPASANFTPPWLPPCKRGPCHGDLWRSGMVPLLPMSFRVALWDQGEGTVLLAFGCSISISGMSEVCLCRLFVSADAKRMNASWYRESWPAMISGWRQELKQPGLPFVYVELDGQMHDEEPHDTVDFWAAQRAGSDLLAVGFATTTDIQRGTHPPDKQDVAVRLALEVRRVALGERIVSRGPELLSVGATRLGNNGATGLVLTFSNNSLVSAGGVLVNSSCTGKQPPKWCGHGCGGQNKADSLAMDAASNQPLHYTISEGEVTVECLGPNSRVRINSDSSRCFLYAAGGSTAVPGGLQLPAPPVLVRCNHTDGGLAA